MKRLPHALISINAFKLKRAFWETLAEKAFKTLCALKGFFSFAVYSVCCYITLFNKIRGWTSVTS